MAGVARQVVRQRLALGSSALRDRPGWLIGLPAGDVLSLAGLQLLQLKLQLLDLARDPL
jgi:hypothetical protein